MYERYTRSTTDQDFLDLAVAAAMTRNDLVTPRPRRPIATSMTGIGLYAACAHALGYDPLNKDLRPKPRKARRRFVRRLSGSLNDLLEERRARCFG